VLEWIQRDRFMRFKVNGGSVALLFLAGVLASPTTWATDPADKARRPPPKPDVRSRAIPELVCTSDRVLDVTHASLATKSEEAPLRLRIAGNLLYLGESAVNERFFAIINRVDRRRWTSGTSTLVLNEALGEGVWTNFTLDTTRISPVRCEPFDAPPRR
jgi:hypothetical protein